MGKPQKKDVAIQEKNSFDAFFLCTAQLYLAHQNKCNSFAIKALRFI